MRSKCWIAILADGTEVPLYYDKAVNSTTARRKAGLRNVRCRLYPA